MYRGVEAELHSYSTLALRRGKRLVFNAPATVRSRKEAQEIIVWMQDGPQSRSGCCGGKHNLLSPPEIGMNPNAEYHRHIHCQW
jgi:hypothetical protein